MKDATDLVGEWAERWRRGGRLVLMLDFDGTLSSIAEDPDLAEIHPVSRASLESLITRSGVELAVISGRALADVRKRVDIRGVIYAGNHGMEIEGPGLNIVAENAASLRPALERARSSLFDVLAEVPGVFVEDKGLTLTVHYRRAFPRDIDRVREAVITAVSGIEALRLTEGKKVLEVRPSVDIDKGTAVEILLHHLIPPPEAPVVYIGDDVTDEDAFRALRAAHPFASESILVSDAAPVVATHATHRLADPLAVAALLARLATEIGD